MRRLIFLAALAWGGVGCGFLAAIPRYSEIERAVTAQEVVGRWLLTTNSLKSVMVDGFVPSKGEEVVINVSSNGSYSCHLIAAGWDGKRIVGRADEEGRWSLDYRPTNHFKNDLVLRSFRDAVSSFHIALDGERMVLWTAWGDPDEGVDLVFEKAAGN